ncbi:MAG TPA: hypothetical protein VFW45_03600 [Candidatus Polarisedimenticolia bacterium]|nr:hypothetical protein [Candidatus Polarisedimenticolia bacterium]
MERARAWILLPAFIFIATALVFAEDHNDDMGVGGSPGVPSAWDQESTNVINGNLHLSIPLYSAKSGADFGYSVVLHYNSKVWDASDSNFPSTPANRSLIAKSPIGLGWTLHMGRVYRLDYSNGTSSETLHYFEASDGSRHRLFHGAKLQSGNCIDDTYWYAHDGSGIRAKFTPSVSGSSEYWQVWAQDGTEIVLSQLVTNSLTTPEQVNFRGWYATGVKSSVKAPGGGPFHWVTITCAPSRNV